MAEANAWLNSLESVEPDEEPVALVLPLVVLPDEYSPSWNNAFSSLNCNNSVETDASRLASSDVEPASESWSARPSRRESVPASSLSMNTLAIAEPPFCVMSVFTCCSSVLICESIVAEAVMFAVGVWRTSSPSMASRCRR